MTVWKGFEYTIDLSKPVGSRVNLDNIDLEASYSVIMTDYLFRHVNKIILNPRMRERRRQSLNI